MKAARILLIIAGVLLAAMLVIPLFIASPARVSSQLMIDLKPEQIFPLVASFENREAWDPWIASDPTYSVTIDSKPGFVGSTYAWEGEDLGKGRMEVLSVVPNERIESSLEFADMDTPAMVIWEFEVQDEGTLVTWSFSQETSYPVKRLGMVLGKVFLRNSFETGLANLKTYLEADTDHISTAGKWNMIIKR